MKTSLNLQFGGRRGGKTHAAQERNWCKCLVGSIKANTAFLLRRECVKCNKEAYDAVSAIHLLAQGLLERWDKVC